MSSTPENAKTATTPRGDGILGYLKQYWHLVLIFILLLFAQWPMIKDWVNIWFVDDSYYSHGPLVPLIVIFMIWINRQKLAETPIKPTWIGLILMLIAFPVHSMALLLELRIMYMFTFFFGLFGAVLMLLGFRMFKILFMPLMFLITMIPIADWMLDSLTARFMLISTYVAHKMLIISGYDVALYGNTINSYGLPQPLLVGTPCSGLRLIISLITFGWFFTYVIKGAAWKKLVLMLTTFPLAIFINSLRITMIGYAGFWTGSKDAMMKFHDYSGYIGLIICFVILFGIAKLLRMGDFVFNEPQEPIVKTERPKTELSASKKMAIFVGVVFVMMGMVSNFVTPLYDLPKGKIPENLITERFDNWVGNEIEIQDNVVEILGKGDLRNLIYVDTNSGRQVNVFIDAALDLSAFHDPHLCMPGGGSPITKDLPIKLSFKEPKEIDVNATVLQATSDYGTALVLYWYMDGENSYPRTENLGPLKRKYIFSDISRLIRNPFALDEIRQDVRERQFIWYRFSTAIVEDEEKDLEYLKEFIYKWVANAEGFGK
ncbi:MAG: exosortase/archaeosortase family protein [Armatimonadota bacterium]